MEGRCERHLFDQAVDLCGRCGGEYCPDCLVYSFGPKKPPFCLPCAVARSGVRSSANNYKPLSGREQRELKRRRAQLQARRNPAAAPEPEAFPTPPPEPGQAVAAAEATLDWLAPSAGPQAVTF